MLCCLRAVLPPILAAAIGSGRIHNAQDILQIEVLHRVRETCVGQFSKCQPYYGVNRLQTRLVRTCSS